MLVELAEVVGGEYFRVDGREEGGGFCVCLIGPLPRRPASLG